MTSSYPSPNPGGTFSLPGFSIPTPANDNPGFKIPRPANDNFPRTRVPDVHLPRIPGWVGGVGRGIWVISVGVFVYELWRTSQPGSDEGLNVENGVNGWTEYYCFKPYVWDKSGGGWNSCAQYYASVLTEGMNKSDGLSVYDDGSTRYFNLYQYDEGPVWPFFTDTIALRATWIQAGGPAYAGPDPEWGPATDPAPPMWAPAGAPSWQLSAAPDLFPPQVPGMQPAPDPAPVPNPHVWPGTYPQSSFGGYSEPGAAPDPFLNQPPLPRPPSPQDREKKFMLAINNGTGVGRLIGFITETDDFIDAVHKGLPWKYQAKPVFENGKWRAATPQEKALAIYNNIEHLNFGLALMHVLVENAKDIGYGRLGRLVARANRLRNRFGGLTLGPAI